MTVGCVRKYLQNEDKKCLSKHMEFINYFLYLVDCGTLSDPENGHVTSHPGHTFESTATYSCNDGYELDGQSTRTCLSTCHWSGNKPTCKLVGKFYS